MSEKLTPEREAELYPHVLHAVRQTAWAIDRNSGEWAAIQEVMILRSRGVRFTPEQIESRVGSREARRDFQVVGSVGILPVYGVLIPRADAFSEMSGASSVQRLSSIFGEMVEDDNVSAIVLDVDSPGGSSFLIAEFAGDIRAARGTKPIVAVANPRAASAAYWIASQADEVVVTKSGDVGSIGTFAIHEDISKALESEGVTITEVASSPEKVETSPFKPLSEAAEAEIKRRVDEMQAMFESDVAKGRRVSVDTVRKDFGNGRMLSAQAAVRVGLVDRIDTLEATVQRLARKRNVQVPVQEPEPVDLVDDDTDSQGTVTDLSSYADARRAAIVAADAVVNRTRAILAAPRGRLSAATRDQLHADAEALEAAAVAIRELSAESAAPETDEADDGLELEFAFAGHAERFRS